MAENELRDGEPCGHQGCLHETHPCEECGRLNGHARCADEELEEMSFIMKIKLNDLARTFYKMEGYTSPEGFDFSESIHPHEKRCWNQAVVAWAALMDDDSALAYQVK